MVHFHAFSIQFYVTFKFTLCYWHFLFPSMQGPPGASSVWIVRHNCNINIGGDTVTKLELLIHPRVGHTSETSCHWGWAELQ